MEPEQPTGEFTNGPDRDTRGEAGADTAEGPDKPKSPLVMSMLHAKWAFFLQRAGRDEKAVEHFASSVELRPSAKAFFGLGTSLASLRRRTEAVDAFRSALDLNPSLVGAHVNLGSVLVAMQDYEIAIGHFHQALDLHPGSREAVMNLANAMRNIGRRSEAIDLVWHHVCMETERTEAQSSQAPAAIDCASWRPWSTACVGLPSVTVVCVKWGTRYDADYVNRLCRGVRRRLPSQMVEAFICFTDDEKGLSPDIECRGLPDGLSLWWGKAYLFSEDAGLDGRRVLFLDLDQVIVGDLVPLADYSGPFALLSTDSISCELADGGYNSSVMAWEASPFFRSIYANLSQEVLKYVHRFDHWLEMNVRGADLWQSIAPGTVVDYTAAFRGGVCVGSAEEEARRGEGLSGGSEDASVDDDMKEVVVLERAELPLGATIVTFPRSPKPHEVLELHAWVRQHWVGETDQQENM